MKNYIRFFCVALMMLCCIGRAYAASEPMYKVQIVMQDVTLNKVADELTRQTGLVFSYSHQVGNMKVKNVEVNLSGSSIEPILKEVFKGTDVRFVVHSNNVDLVLKSDTEVSSSKQAPKPVGNAPVSKKVRITGCVTDKLDNQPLIGVVVRLFSYSVSIAL